MWPYFKTILKQYGKSPFTYVSIIFPIAFLFGLGQVVPVSYIYSTIVSISIIMVAFFLFGGTILEIRKTSLIKSISLTRLSKSKVLIVNLITALIFTTIIIIIISLIVFFLTIGNSNFLATDWSFWSDQKILLLLSGDIYWEDVKWGLYFYSLILGVLLAYGLAFLLISLSKSSTTLYLWSFFYLLFFMFGTYTSIPNIFVFGKSKDIPSIEILLDLRYVVPNYYSNQTMQIALSNDATYNFIESLLEEAGLNSETATEITDVIFNKLGNVQNWDWDNLINDATIFASSTNSELEASFQSVQAGGPSIFSSETFQNLEKISVDFLGNEVPATIVFKNVDSLNTFITNLFSEPAEDWLKFFIDPFVLFDISDSQSILYSFTPLVMIIVFIGAGVKKFEWSIR
ncbi:hypothetical protein X271_00425 [Candidatus Hepatoplasma crinochetorum Av]|uniref:ABC-2 family transporter protein n=1 Tax=Candidatus Hepatoplasma crinochetorum Av TaxID=1427984 RepID=W8GSY7_9MOLU|nr:hypothetical protein [Candidatus Hepatoplasma crinochetorum]AHK22530.1 hypothetical protein X271_00425 [Candidatus Hepatoplasma crinochetorum Av]